MAWLAEQTGKNYRLLSEAEYEYAARAGSTTPFWWGATISPDWLTATAIMPMLAGLKGSYRAETVSVQSFSPNPWGLYHVSGNAWTWTKDCWHDNYLGAPSDGSAWMTGECRSLRHPRWLMEQPSGKPPRSEPHLDRSRNPWQQQRLPRHKAAKSLTFRLLVATGARKHRSGGRKANPMAGSEMNAYQARGDAIMGPDSGE